MTSEAVLPDYEFEKVLALRPFEEPQPSQLGRQLSQHLLNLVARVVELGVHRLEHVRHSVLKLVQRRVHDVLEDGQGGEPYILVDAAHAHDQACDELLLVTPNEHVVAPEDFVVVLHRKGLRIVRRVCVADLRGTRG